MSEYVRHDDLGTVIRALTRRIEALERKPYFRVPLQQPEFGYFQDFWEDGDMWFETETDPKKLRIAYGGDMFSFYAIDD